jgi:hypothetical protein
VGDRHLLAGQRARALGIGLLSGGYGREQRRRPRAAAESSAQRLPAADPGASLPYMSRHGAIRASDADRDQIVDRLHRAATEGRIASEELEHRVSIALKAKTYSELEATVADLPRLRSRPRNGLERRRTAGSWAVSTVRANPMLLLLVIPVLAVTLAVVVTITVLWAVLMLLALMFGGRRRHGPPPWVHAVRGGLGPMGRPLGPWGARPSRGSGRRWGE